MNGDQEHLIALLNNQLDALQSMTTSVVGIALVSLWASFQGKKGEAIPIPFLNAAPVSRNAAFWLLGSLFFLATLESIVYFTRLADLIRERAANEVTIRALGAHPWALNPFAYFGSSSSTRVRDILGYPTLIFIWWIGVVALISIRAGTRLEHFWRLALLFAVSLVIGICAEFSMYGVLSAIKDQVPGLDVGSLSVVIAGSWSLHNCATAGGVLLGLAILLLLLVIHPYLGPYLIETWRAKPAPTQDSVATTPANSKKRKRRLFRRT